MDRDPRAEHVEGLGYHTEHPLGDGDSRIRPIDVLEDDGELVATETGAGVLLAETALEPARDRDQKLVSSRMPEAVIHRLEVVQVDEQHADERVLAPGEAKRVGHTVGEERAVRESRERVVERLMRKLLLERTPLGHVSGGNDDRRDVRVVEQVHEDTLELTDRPVSAPEWQVSRHGPSGGTAHLAEERAQPLAFIRLEQLRQRLPDELVLRVTEHTLDGRRVVPDLEVALDQHDDVARVLDERAEALSALALVEVLG